MDQALIEHAKHNIDSDQGGQDQDRLVSDRFLENLGASRRSRWLMLAGRFSSRTASSMTCVARSRVTPGARLNEMVTAANWPWWLTASGTLKARSGQCCLAAPFFRPRRSNKDLVECTWIVLKLRVDFENDAVLILRPAHNRNLALSKGTIERGVNGFGLNAQPPRGIAVDHHICLQALKLLVAIDVSEFRRFFSAARQAEAPRCSIRPNPRPRECIDRGPWSSGLRPGCPAPAEEKVVMPGTLAV